MGLDISKVIMKIILCLVGCSLALAAPQQGRSIVSGTIGATSPQGGAGGAGAGAGAGGAGGAGAGGGAGGAGGAAAAAAPVNPKEAFGLAWYGPGLNNPSQFVQKVDPKIIPIGNRILAQNPNLRIRVGLGQPCEFAFIGQQCFNDEITVTDTFGVEIEIEDQCGFTPFEPVSPLELQQCQQERQQQQLEFVQQSPQFNTQLRQFDLQQQQARQKFIQQQLRQGANQFGGGAGTGFQRNFFIAQGKK